MTALGQQPNTLSSDRAFARADHFVKTWWPLVASDKLKPGQVKSVQLPDRRIVVYRTSAGHAVVMNGVCPHMGANLAHGAVIGDDLRCAFHHLVFQPDGKCADKRTCVKVESYPVAEKWGFVWMFNGPEPTFDLPDIGEKKWLRLHFPSSPFAYHFHLVIANLYDLAHFRSVHKLQVSAEAKLEIRSPAQISIEFPVSPISKLLGFLSNTLDRPFGLRSTIYGDNIALVKVDHHFPYYVCYACRPVPGNRCQIETFVFMDRKWHHLPAYAWIMFLHWLQLLDDNRILSDLDFSPNFTPQNKELEILAGHVNRMPTWPARVEVCD